MEDKNPTQELFNEIPSDFFAHIDISDNALDISRIDENKLIVAMMTDIEFLHNVIDSMDSKYFRSPHAQLFFRIIKHGYKTNIFVNEDILPTMIMELYAENIDGGKIEIDIFEKDIKIHFKSDLTLIKRNATNFIIKSRQRLWYEKINSKVKSEKALLTQEDIEDLQDTFVVEEMDSEYEFHQGIRKFIHDEEVVKIPTGYIELDGVFNGGIAKGTFGLIMAFSGSGKSTFMTALASNAIIRGFKVLHITFEDDMRSISKKIATHRYNTLKGLDEITGININYVNEFSDEIMDMPKDSIYIFSQKKKNITTIRDIENQVKKNIQKYGSLDLVVIDYADCLFAKKDGNGSYENDQLIYRDIERMALKYNVAIWTATQANRSGSNNENMGPESVSGSIKKVQVAPIILSLNKTDAQKQFGCATIKVIKNRNGSDGMSYRDIIFDNGKLVIDFDKRIDNPAFQAEKEKDKNKDKK